MIRNRYHQVPKINIVPTGEIQSDISRLKGHQTSDFSSYPVFQYYDVVSNGSGLESMWSVQRHPEREMCTMEDAVCGVLVSQPFKLAVAEWTLYYQLRM